MLAGQLWFSTGAGRTWSRVRSGLSSTHKFPGGWSQDYPSGNAEQRAKWLEKHGARALQGSAGGQFLILATSNARVLVHNGSVILHDEFDIDPTFLGIHVEVRRLLDYPPLDVKVRQVSVYTAAGRSNVLKTLLEASPDKAVRHFIQEYSTTPLEAVQGVVHRLVAGDAPMGLVAYIHLWPTHPLEALFMPYQLRISFQNALDNVTRLRTHVLNDMVAMRSAGAAHIVSEAQGMGAQVQEAMLDFFAFAGGVKPFLDLRVTLVCLFPLTDPGVFGALLKRARAALFYLFAKDEGAGDRPQPYATELTEIRAGKRQDSQGIRYGFQYITKLEAADKRTENALRVLIVVAPRDAVLGLRGWEGAVRAGEVIRPGRDAVDVIMAEERGVPYTPASHVALYEGATTVEVSSRQFGSGYDMGIGRFAEVDGAFQVLLEAFVQKRDDVVSRYTSQVLTGSGQAYKHFHP